MEASLVMSGELLRDDKIVEVIEIFALHYPTAQDLAAMQMLARSKPHGEDIRLGHLID